MVLEDIQWRSSGGGGGNTAEFSGTSTGCLKRGVILDFFDFVCTVRFGCRGIQKEIVMDSGHLRAGTLPPPKLIFCVYGKPLWR